MQRRTMFAAGTAAAAGMAAGSGPGWPVAGKPAKAAGSRAAVPNTAVVDQDGRALRFYDDLVRDRVVLLNFFYTGCAETCPLVTENLRAVQDILGERMGRDIFLLSVSLQPELETPAILKDYADQWDVRPGWKFLTGRPEDVEQLRRAMGFASADPDYDLILDNHIGLLRYGNERLNRWAGTPGLARPAWIAKAVTSIAGRA
jgi:protein SCO1/2